MPQLNPGVSPFGGAKPELDVDAGGTVARQGNALTRRAEQLRRWAESETSRANEAPKRGKGSRSVNFPDGIVFLAVCASGDKADIGRLIQRGADVNTANVDGLTALHQACIDENIEMVKFLLDSGVDVDFCDNEGWTPLHATASCGYVDIAECLIARGANVDYCNNDGDLPVDIAASTEMKELLEREMEKISVDAEAARRVEEDRMLADAAEWALAHRIEEQRHPKSGATALHVAAAKGYLEVMRLLLDAGAGVDATDNDGWTPLHAAAHWGQKEAADLLLLEADADCEAANNVGQTPFDVADTEMVEHLEDLRDKQLQQRRRRNNNNDAAVAAAAETHCHSGIHSRGSEKDSRRSSVTRMSIDQKESKKLKDLEAFALETSVDEDEDEEEEDDEEEEEEEKKKTTTITSSRPASITLPVGGAASVGNPTVGTVTPMIRGAARPASVPAAAAAAEASSSPVLSASDWRCLAAATSTDPPTANPPARITTTTATFHLPAPPPADSVGASTSPQSPLQQQHPTLQAQQSLQQQQPRMFEPPKRDEESEAQRKAKSRRARETRRSTQGVTPEDLQAAEILLTSEPKDASSSSSSSAPDPASSSAPKDLLPAPTSPTSTPAALADTLKQSDSFRRRARGSRHDTQDSVSSTSSAASSSSSGSSSTSSTLTAGSSSVAAASPVFTRSSRFAASSSLDSASAGGGGDGIGVGRSSIVPSVVVSAGGDPGAGEAIGDDAGGAGDRSSVGLDADSAYKRSSAITKRRLRAQRRSTGIAFEEDAADDKDGGSGDGKNAGGAADETGDAEPKNDAVSSQRYYRSSAGLTSKTSSTPESVAASSSSSSSVAGLTLAANAGIADRYARPTASATSYRQAAELDYKRLYDEEKHENERLRMKLSRMDSEMTDMRTQMEKNQKNLLQSTTSSNNNAFLVDSIKEKQNLERTLAETLEELKMLEQLKADNMRLKEENGALIRVISKLSK